MNRVGRFSGLVLVVSSLAAACGDDGAPGGHGGQTTTGATKASGATSASATSGSTTTGATSASATTGAASTSASSTSASSSTGMPAEPECTFDADCFVNDDCCECAGHLVGEKPPQCAVDCNATVCERAGVVGLPAVCRAGRCVGPVDCNSNTVTCDLPPPVCPPGTAPAVNAQGNCWIMPSLCIPVTECTSVGTCASCGTDLCVEQVSFLPTLHCVVPPGECAVDDCDCLGPSTCIDPFDACGVADGHITCTCVTC